ncbi:unnamed protein product [Rhizoctonia solani]|uniref:Fatty acid desaturase domain-containing protein n=1 Tax=Rhizoctonia solani TaxID=456999 RepID=A0A8H3DPW0_9AGAM|nr:unnamed protein product [Rhizoctonia solani]
MGLRQKAKAAARAASNSPKSQSVSLPTDGPETFIVPELTVKDCLSVIPPHCFERSALRSFSYIGMDFALLGGVDEKVQEELVDAVGDSPIGATLGVFALLLLGWPMYLIMNVSGQNHYPAWTNHFVPKAPLFQPHQYSQILFSDFGIFLWLGTLIWWSVTRGVYFVPYLWVNHWLILITFLQHTDPLLPHYRQSAFTFTRGALSTLDRNLLGGEGFIASVTGWLGATLTHGISETHVLHHVCSKIPHYHAWEASRHLKARLARAGYSHEGRPGTWGEVYRVWKECKFIEDEGDVVFYKNARGLAARQAVFANEGMSDSGIEVDVK